MHEDHYRQTAKIYVFPVRPRNQAKGASRDEDFSAFRNYPDVSSWYHKDAIDDAREAQIKTHAPNS